ncbi:hypothetical protein [Actinoplanes sp. NPDC049118]|uniref:hypothetical protein n=1 Tax=Actinoplanes sp. NPDC049118 TaxID=3155769 RepID=UPI0033C8CCB2
MSRCPWCAGNLTDDIDPEALCRAHAAEYDGLTESELDRMEAEQAAEYADAFDQ